jgi:hypothetical protein
MGVGSYLRFFVGLLLSIEIIRLFLSGETVSQWAFYISVAFIILTVLFALEKAGAVPHV